MTSSEYSEIQDVLERAFVEEFGSAASADELLRSVASSLPEHLDHYLRVAGLKTAIGTFFRRKRSDGLPQAPEVNDEGTHKQIDLLTVPEYRYVIEGYLKSSESSITQARKLAVMCEEVHGVTIVLKAKRTVA